jgi:hypothetical protein
MVAHLDEVEARLLGQHGLAHQFQRGIRFGEKLETNLH